MAMASGRTWFRKLTLTGLGLIVGLSVALIVALAFDVDRRLSAQHLATSDIPYWSMAQLEVETQLLREILSTPDPDLTDLRRSFDIVFARITILETGAVYLALRQTPAFAAALARLTAFADGAQGVMDGPDPALTAALPALRAGMDEVRQAARTISVLGIDHAAQVADRQQAATFRTLLQVAGVGALLIAGLTVLATVLLRLSQRIQSQARDNELTTARLETILTTSVDAIVVMDHAGRILEFNPAAELVFEHSRAEVLGATATALLLPPDSVEDTLVAIQSLLDSARTGSSGKQRIELEALRKTGDRFPIELSVAMAHSAEGDIYVAFLRDISDRRQAERDLTEARDQALRGERARAEFLAVMSHEMRTPLNGLLGSVEILGATPLQAPQREILEVIETSGQVLLHHVNSVLDLSSAEAGSLQPDHTPFVLEALVREVVANQSGLAASGGNEIDIVPVSDPVGRVLGDPARVRQVLLNLVGNAVKFTRNGRIRIEIDAEMPTGATREVEIRVIDTGIGIAEADQARIFEDFVTLDSSYGRETSGTGLGLGITRRLIEVLGGSIGVESDPGQGSVFWVRLPFGLEKQPGHAGCENQPQGQCPGIAPLSVLLVEDNAINRFVLRTLLEETGHSVVEAADGLEGLTQASDRAFDVILMDISMPRLDGVAAARHIRNHDGPSRAARIVAVTAHALPEELERFRLAGIDDCLVKPVNRATLARALAGDPIQPGTVLPDEGHLPLIDTVQFDDLLARVAPATAARLLGQFIEEGDATVAALRAGARGPEADNLRHRLAGSAATFGAARLAGRLVDRDRAPLRPPSPPLSDLWSATRAALLARSPKEPAT
jgi:PAS domain S-box-containing protein